MKKIRFMWIMLVIVMSATAVIAQTETEQQKMSPERKSEIMSERLAERLDLNNIQKVKIKELILDNQRKKQQMKVESAEHRESFQNSLRTVMTPAQRIKFDQMLNEKREQRARQRELKQFRDH